MFRGSRTPLIFRELWTFYSVKIHKCESFLIALRRNFKKWTFLLRNILKSRPLLIALRKNAKKWNILLRKTS